MAEKNNKKEQLLNLLLDHFGSPEAAWEQASRSALQQLLQKQNLTFGELIDSAREGGWLDYLRTQPLHFQSPASTNADAKPRTKRGSNTSKILRYLRSHPKSSAGDIAQATRLEGSTISSTLQYLAKSNRVKGTGTGRAKVWSAK